MVAHIGLHIIFNHPLGLPYGYLGRNASLKSGIHRKRLTIPHRVSEAGLWEMWQRWGYECDESYATARGGAA